MVLCADMRYHTRARIMHTQQAHARTHTNTHHAVCVCERPKVYAIRQRNVWPAVFYRQSAEQHTYNIQHIHSTWETIHSYYTHMYTYYIVNHTHTRKNRQTPQETRGNRECKKKRGNVKMTRARSPERVDVYILYAYLNVQSLSVRIP